MSDMDNQQSSIPKGGLRYRMAWLLRRLPMPLLVLAIGVGGFSLLLVTRPQTKPVENREIVWNVAGLNVAYGAYQPQITAYGELRARREVHLRAQVSGEVMATAEGFEDGARVAKGEALLTIDPFNYETKLADAEAQLKGAKAVLTERKAAATLAKQDVTRMRTLFKKGTVSQKTLDDKRTDYTIKKARREQQQSIVDRQEVLVKRAKRDLAHTKIIAPFDGHIANILAREGRVVNLNDPIATLLDAGNFDVVFNLSDAEYGRFLARNSDVIGRRLTVHWDIGGERVALEAVIERVGAQISQSTRGVDVFATVTSNIPATLRGGAFVNVTLKAQPLPDVMTIPKDAIYNDNRVFLIENGRLSERELVNPIDLGRTVAVRHGLRDGEIVLLTRFNEAAEGVAVKLVESR